MVSITSSTTSVSDSVFAVLVAGLVILLIVKHLASITDKESFNVLNGHLSIFSLPLLFLFMFVVVMTALSEVTQL